MELLAVVWATMVAHYAQAWTKRYGESPITRDGEVAPHALAIIEAMQGLTRQQIDAGLKALTHEISEFPPSPARFRVLCLGIPPIAAVELDMAAPYDEREPFTVFVCQHLDTYRFSQSTEKQRERMLRQAYDLAVEKRMKGEALPTRSPKLEAPAKRKFVPVTPEDEAWWKENCRRLLAGEPELDPATKPTPESKP